MNTETARTKETQLGSSIFGRLLVGIDGSPESVEAARQAATLAQGPVTLLAAYDLVAGLVGGVGPATPAMVDEAALRATAEERLELARDAFGGTATLKLGEGRPWDLLLHEIDRAGATLVAVGSHGHSRPVGIVIGSTATELIHKAPCSVLVARTALGAFPSRIVVGLDGSAESLGAYEVAQALARRFEARLIPIAACLEDDVDPDAIEQRVGTRVRSVFDHPVEALVSASAESDLVVVGSRGLRGLRSLGSVSEQVAHQAASSVLIVRAAS
jgi:nucleotide-binding universal stress UspA family protein